MSACPLYVIDTACSGRKGYSLSANVLREEARYRFLKFRDAATVPSPRLPVEELGLQVPGRCMCNSLVNLLLRELLRYEPALAEGELLSVKDFLDVLSLSWWHQIGFGEYPNTSRRGIAIFDELERRRCFNILISA